MDILSLCLIFQEFVFRKIHMDVRTSMERVSTLCVYFMGIKKIKLDKTISKRNSVSSSFLYLARVSVVKETYMMNSWWMLETPEKLVRIEWISSHDKFLESIWVSKVPNLKRPLYFTTPSYFHNFGNLISICISTLRIPECC